MKMTHPDTDLEIEVQADVADVYRSQGWQAPPKGNASLEEWQTYARSTGLSADDVEGKTRDELRTELS